MCRKASMVLSSLMKIQRKRTCSATRVKLNKDNGSQTVLVNYTTSNPQACSSIVEFYVSMRPKDDKGEIIKHNPDGSPFIPRYDVACDSEVLILAKS